MRKFITGAIIVPLMCLTICARDFDLNGISALNISGSGDNTNIQPPRVLALNNINDAYDFPVKPGTAEWKALNIQERLKVCQIPEPLLKKISTAGLIGTVLNYPFYWANILTANSGLQQAFSDMAAYFNGIQELLARKDAGSELLLKYRSIPPPKKEATDMEIGDYLFYCYSFEILFAQDVIRAGLTEAQLKAMKKELLAKYETRRELNEAGGLSKEIMKVNNVLPQENLPKESATTVYTPKGSTVPARQMDPKTDEYGEKEMLKCNQLIDVAWLGPLAKRESNCSLLYNCHSYTWHYQSISNMIRIYKPNQQQYWLDGSYSPWLGPTVESGMKLDYFSDDHSAIFVSGQDPTADPAMAICRSKWGYDGPVMWHNCAYTPPIYNPGGGIHAYTLPQPAGN